MAGAVTAGSSESADLRAPIAASWERSQEAGVDPFVERVAPAVADADEVAARWEVHPLSAVAPLIRQYVEAAGDAQGIIVVTDAQGTVLWVDGDPNVRFDAAGMCNLQEGASWNEADAGTNAIGTGLAAQRALQVFASEHFNEVVHAWTCSAAPVRDPDRGELLGIVDLTGRSSTAHPYSLASAVAIAGAVEAHLRSAMLERDARLRSRYEEGLRRGGRRVLVSSSGRILSSHPDGWLSAERLSLPPEGGG
jgi:transcriptional regulator of acetoin/glycerol metabolism